VKPSIKISKNTAVNGAAVIEDAVTAKLATLIGSDEKAKQLFLNFLFDAATAEQFSRHQLIVESQHRTSHGKIDLLLYDSTVGIIVESKVRDRQKVFQLQSYYDWWLGRTGKPPFVFWLVRRIAVGLGRNEFLTRELTWNQLYDHFRARAVEIDQASSRNAVNAFCDWLKFTGVLLKPSDKRTVQRRNKGYSYERAEEVLEAIGSSFSDVKFRVESPENELLTDLLSEGSHGRASLAVSESNVCGCITSPIKGEEESRYFSSVLKLFFGITSTELALMLPCSISLSGRSSAVNAECACGETNRENGRDVTGSRLHRPSRSADQSSTSSQMMSRWHGPGSALSPTSEVRSMWESSA
jgi:hypothetical protein